MVGVGGQVSKEELALELTLKDEYVVPPRSSIREGWIKLGVWMNSRQFHLFSH